MIPQGHLPLMRGIQNSGTAIPTSSGKESLTIRSEQGKEGVAFV
jgi:hypothetical protein